MFNENDLRFVTERLKGLEDTADQERKLSMLRQNVNCNPLWVRILNAVLERSRWTLIPKSETKRQGMRMQRF
jgi:hypothetical protein